MWNLPNILTLLRIAMIPVFIVVYYMTSWEWHNLAAAAIFGLAAATDWVDGYVARKYNLITAFGAFLDPVADKLIVVAAMVVLLEVHATPWFALPAIVIIGEETVSRPCQARDDGCLVISLLIAIIPKTAATLRQLSAIFIRPAVVVGAV